MAVLEVIAAGGKNEKQTPRLVEVRI